MRAPRTARALLWATLGAGTHAWPADAPAELAHDARDFLLRYAGLTAAADAAAIELYADEARIHITMATPNGKTTMVLDGHHWKRELRAGWFDRGVRLEASSFANPSVRSDTGRLQIRAQRYSHARCYWDRGYSVTVEPDEAGRYRIVDERLSIRRDTMCPSRLPTGVPRKASSPIGEAASSDPLPTIPTARGPLPPNVVPSTGLPPRLPSRPSDPGRKP